MCHCHYEVMCWEVSISARSGQTLLDSRGSHNEMPPVQSSYVLHANFTAHIPPQPLETIPKYKFQPLHVLIAAQPNLYRTQYSEQRWHSGISGAKKGGGLIRTALQTTLKEVSIDHLENALVVKFESMGQKHKARKRPRTLEAQNSCFARRLCSCGGHDEPPKTRITVKVMDMNENSNH